MTSHVVDIHVGGATSNGKRIEPFLLFIRQILSKMIVKRNHNLDIIFKGTQGHRGHHNTCVCVGEESDTRFISF